VCTELDNGEILGTLKHIPYATPAGFVVVCDADPWVSLVPRSTQGYDMPPLRGYSDWRSPLSGQEPAMRCEHRVRLASDRVSAILGMGDFLRANVRVTMRTLNKVPFA